MGVGPDEGSAAFAQSGDAGAEKIAAKSTLAGPAGVEIGPALAREPTSSSEAKNRKVDLIFMRSPLKDGFTDELRRSQQPLKKKVPELSADEPACHRRVSPWQAVPVAGSGSRDIRPRA
jgi:hypothetical protein